MSCLFVIHHFVHNNIKDLGNTVSNLQREVINLQDQVLAYDTEDAEMSMTK